MDRKQFIKNTAFGVGSLVGGVNMLKAKNIKVKKSTYEEMATGLESQVGFNHLPPEGNSLIHKNSRTMNTILHKAETRGHANHGWLNSHHTFSFANYYNPERMNFGVLRVLNDDLVSEGRGFGTHPHDNMEIISIPLEGDLEHKDSMGNVAVIREGDVQVMSAGTGIFHSEYNKNKDEPVKFLQIWVFPNKKDVKPRYDQITLDKEKMKNQFHQVLSPNHDDEGVWVHQDAWFHMADLDGGVETNYTLKGKNSGVYAFIIEGDVEINGQELNTRDGYGIWDVEMIEIKASSNARVLLMEVPMNLN